MGDAIIKIYQKQNFVIGEDVLKRLKEANLNLDEALLIIYFCSNNNHPILDIEEIKKKFSINEMDIMQAFDNLLNKHLIEIVMKKNNDGKMEEIIDLTPLYQSIVMDIDEKTRKNNNQNIFNTFENEFGRPLSSIEYELINKWLDKGINESLINSALKEAIFNGSLTLRYIDAVLSEWTRKGFKTGQDVDIYLKKKKDVKINSKKEDLFDYNWLDDEE